MTKDFDKKTVEQLVQQLFAYPEGPLVLEWLEELYCFHKFQGIVQSGNPNAPLAMSYQAGKADLVKELQYIVKVGLPENQEEEDIHEGGIEYGY